VAGDPLQLQELLQDLYQLSSKYEQGESSNKLNGQLSNQEDDIPQLLQEQLEQQDIDGVNLQDCHKKLLVHFYTKEVEATESPLNSEADLKLFTQYIEQVFEQAVYQAESALGMHTYSAELVLPEEEALVIFKFEMDLPRTSSVFMSLLGQQQKPYQFKHLQTALNVFLARHHKKYANDLCAWAHITNMAEMAKGRSQAAIELLVGIGFAAQMKQTKARLRKLSNRLYWWMIGSLVNSSLNSSPYLVRREGIMISFGFCHFRVFSLTQPS
jgi:hypothetical protein